jgi:hypothetical protein
MVGIFGILRKPILGGDNWTFGAGLGELPGIFHGWRWK